MDVTAAPARNDACWTAAAGWGAAGAEKPHTGIPVCGFVIAMLYDEPFTV